MNNKLVVLTLTLALLVAGGCSTKTLDDYKQTVRSARQVLPIAVEMEELFPVADHFITHYGFDDKPKAWNTEVFFGGRYTLTMQVDVEIDYDNNKIKRMVGKPVFYLVEIKKIELRPGGLFSARSGDGAEFSAAEWKQIYESKGDFVGVGFKLNPAPVDHFEKFVTGVRKDRIPVSLLEK